EKVFTNGGIGICWATAPPDNAARTPRTAKERMGFLLNGEGRGWGAGNGGFSVEAPDRGREKPPGPPRARPRGDVGGGGRGGAGAQRASRRTQRRMATLATRRRGQAGSTRRWRQTAQSHRPSSAGPTVVRRTSAVPGGAPRAQRPRRGRPRRVVAVGVGG